MATHSETLQSHYPWAALPLITSAPMRLITHEDLTLAVSRAQGIGFIGAGTDVGSLSTLLKNCTASLQQNPIPNTPPDILPIGVGFLCWGADLEATLSILRSASTKPAAAWLFAPKETSDLVTWSKGIREVSAGKTKIWIQVGAVADALEVACTCSPDVLIIQGSDAGGHGLAQSSSIISLFPECFDALAKEGFGNIPLIATGGITDGRGVAAAAMLGASGVCMGTRFLCSPEAAISDGYRNAVLNASDGGVNTARTTVYDKLRKTSGWPERYNARGVLNHSFWDHEKGMEEEENRKLYDEAVKMGDEGWGEKARMTTYAGTGVGLIKEIMSAGDIAREVREEARALLARGTNSL
jgi:nitronate monooxygenase